MKHLTAMIAIAAGWLVSACSSNNDGANSGALACSQSADVACRGDPTCPPDWTHACATGLTLQRCGPYDVASMVEVDTGIRYYYDASTGKLVATVSFCNEEVQICGGGPPHFTPPSPVDCTGLRSCTDASM